MGGPRGYTSEQTKLAIFAWSPSGRVDPESPPAGVRPLAPKPLQEELFGIDIAGEIFFTTFSGCSASAIRDDLADVLSYELCLLLGFRGRYD